MTCHYPVFENTGTITNLIMEDFHDYTMMILISITIFLIVIILRLFLSSYVNNNLLAGQVLEIIWTIVPMVILFFIAYPSLFYLYLTDLSINPATTIKVYGAQWYWTYEYSDFKNYKQSSYMLSYQELNPWELGWRLLECDFRGMLPYGVEIRVLVTSQDVIHSFAIPAIGLKVDAIPGRLNWTTLFMAQPCTMYGQCAEICGVGHAFMPISLDFVHPLDFISTMKELSSKD